MLKIAFCGVSPHAGGTYTVYKHLRDGLARHNIDLRWLSMAKYGTKIEDIFEQDEGWGEFLFYKESQEEIIGNFIKHIELNYSGIIFNVLTSPYQTNCARYISNKLIKLQIVHNITPATYRAAHSIKNYVHATIGISPRIVKDLISKFSFSEKLVHNISNSINIENFSKYRSGRTQDQPLKLLSLGRIEESSKGILWLPDILDKCIKEGYNVTMTVAGDGIDLPQLKLKIRKIKLDNYVNFIGEVKYALIPEIFSQHHVFLMPSRYEGFGLTLLEAMTTGCVPVCSKISNVTDFVISDGEDGFLFSVGEVNQSANLIGQLTNINVWQKMSENAIISSQNKFSIEKQASSYAKLIYDLKENLPPIAETLSVKDWKLPAGLKPSFSVYVPKPIKNIIRVWRERLNSS